MEITNDAEHEVALREAESLMNAEVGTPEGDRLSELADAIVAYEEKRWPL